MWELNPHLSSTRESQKYRYRNSGFDVMHEMEYSLYQGIRQIELKSIESSPDESYIPYA